MSTLKFDKWLNADGTPRQNIIQVVQSVKTDTYAGSGNDTWLDTGFYANITPKFNTSKILLTMTLMGASSYWELAGKFQRKIGAGAAVDIGIGDRGTQTNGNMGAGFMHSHYMNNYQSLWYPCNYTFLDSPATTSVLEYRLWLNPFTTYFAYINRTLNDVDSADYNGCPISTIILMEVAG